MWEASPLADPALGKAQESARGLASYMHSRYLLASQPVPPHPVINEDHRQRRPVHAH